MTDIQAIRDVYDTFAEDEYNRLAKSPLHESEFVLTADLLAEHIEEGASVLDVGAGAGRYAEHLIRTQNCRVGLVDLSSESLKLFQQRVGTKLSANILFCRQSSVTDLSWIEPTSFDAVLLLGPLYHLVAPGERAAALSHTRRSLKPNGLIVAAFISPYNCLARLLSHPEHLEDPDAVRRLLATGETHHRGMQQWRCWPTRARQMMENAGFTTVTMRNLEGIGSLLGDTQRENLTTGDRKQAWFDILRATCEIPELLGATLHFVYVGRRSTESLQSG